MTKQQLLEALDVALANLTVFNSQQASRATRTDYCIHSVVTRIVYFHTAMRLERTDYSSALLFTKRPDTAFQFYADDLFVEPTDPQYEKLDKVWQLAHHNLSCRLSEESVLSIRMMPVVDYTESCRRRQAQNESL